MPDVQTLLPFRRIDRDSSRFVPRDVDQSMLPCIPGHPQVHKQLIPIVSDQRNCITHRLMPFHLMVRLHTALRAMPSAREVRKNTYPSPIKRGKCLCTAHFFKMRPCILQVL
ncbi:hypothetical protein WK53_28025 [Burkholderia ubonensis]|uniref:Uncharacterized protein n=1 Tax=Burkholderia ubonensis TaxID=101571 RepID=A0AAW3NJB3_9BURK|nr:hypothetical protein WK53_28025 [Burkholderia ubonensis]